MTSGLPVDFSIRRSQRAKNTRLVVKKDSVEVVAPHHVPVSVITQFVKARKDWINTARQRLQIQQKAVKSLAPEKYKAGALIPYLGQHWPLIIEHDKDHMMLDFQPEQGFVVKISGNPAADYSDEIKHRLYAWMKAQALQQANVLIKKHAQQVQLFPRKISIKLMKSRWGSCGIHNDINLNVLLLLAPEPVFEYVVVHELCHIKHRNHSAAFWSLVEQHLPEYRQHRHWLKEHGHNVMEGL